MVSGYSCKWALLPLSHLSFTVSFALFTLHPPQFQSESTLLSINFCSSSAWRSFSWVLRETEVKHEGNPSNIVTDLHPAAPFHSLWWWVWFECKSVQLKESCWSFHWMAKCNSTGVFGLQRLSCPLFQWFPVLNISCGRRPIWKTGTMSLPLSCTTSHLSASLHTYLRHATTE